MKLETDDLVADLNRWHRAYIRQIKALSYSNNTLELYNRAILQFIEYMHEYQEDIMIVGIRAHHFTGFLGWMEEQAEKQGKSALNGNILSKSTKETYLKAVKAFFTFISDNNDELVTFERFFKNIRIANDTKPEGKIDYLTTQEVSSLISVLERQKSKSGDYGSYRDSLLIRLMLFAGLRISEALGVKLSDISRSSDDTFAIKVFAKGGIFQEAHIDSRKIEDELEYFKKVAALAPDEYIMQTRSGKRMTRQGAYQVASTLYRHAGVRHDGLHILRHTFAMWMTSRGVDLVDIKDALRHSSITTTTVYAKATKESVIKAVLDPAKEEKWA